MAALDACPSKGPGPRERAWWVLRSSVWIRAPAAGPAGSSSPSGFRGSRETWSSYMGRSTVPPRRPTETSRGIPAPHGRKGVGNRLKHVEGGRAIEGAVRKGEAHRVSVHQGVASRYCAPVMDRAASIRSVVGRARLVGEDGTLVPVLGGLRLDELAPTSEKRRRILPTHLCVSPGPSSSGVHVHRSHPRGASHPPWAGTQAGTSVEDERGSVWSAEPTRA